MKRSELAQKPRNYRDKAVNGRVPKGEGVRKISRGGGIVGFRGATTVLFLISSIDGRGTRIAVGGISHRSGVE